MYGEMCGKCVESLSVGVFAGAGWMIIGIWSPETEAGRWKN